MDICVHSYLNFFKNELHDFFFDALQIETISQFKFFELYIKEEKRENVKSNSTFIKIISLSGKLIPIALTNSKLDVTSCTRVARKDKYIEKNSLRP